MNANIECRVRPEVAERVAIMAARLAAGLDIWDPSRRLTPEERAEARPSPVFGGAVRVITAATVKGIKAGLAAGVSQRHLARRFGMCPQRIARVAAGCYDHLLKGNRP